MRRPFAFLLMGAVSVGALAPAAGAADLPKLPFLHRKPAVKLACKVVREDDAPAVACRWSAREAAEAFTLRRGGGAGGRVEVYAGPEFSFVDPSVEGGSNYVYKVEAHNSDGRRVAQSRAVPVRVPDGDPVPEEPVPVTRPEKKPAAPAAKPAPAKASKPAVAAEPKPAVKPTVPATKPLPPPAPKPAPQPTTKPQPEIAPKPAVKPAPTAVARIKLACAPRRVASGTEEAGRAVVVCDWAAPADLPVAGYQLWRADKAEGTKQVIFRTADGTRSTDEAVTAGHQYVYLVKALDADGRVIAQSDGVWVPLAAPTTTTTSPSA
jgi:hypothetical protein